MKKRYVIISLLAASLSVRSQSSDSLYSKKSLAKTDVQMLFSYYTQDNNHSAVTGGIGTEDLQVYSTQLFLDHQRDSSRATHLSAGLDIISSASTDNIDFEMSSASRHDFRVYTKFGIERQLRGTGYRLGVNAGLSLESDYFSVGPGISLSHINATQSRQWSLALQTYFDDLRWFDHGRHDGLVYPIELRNREWFDHFRRHSFNLAFGFHQVINRRTTIGLYPGITYQTGLLSTPFHRVYFVDDSKRVENLPTVRTKVPIGIQLNTFIGGGLILRTYYRFYWDDFGVVAHTVNIESPIKLSRKVTLIPVLRWYTQAGTEYFKPYGQHPVEHEFYTSDYDLSTFTSVKPGLGFRYAPYTRTGRRTFNEIEVRYALYHRSDGLTAHMITTFLDFQFDKKD